MSSSDTIIALSTGWAGSPRALVRMSGPEVRALCAELLSDPGRVGASVASAFACPAMDDSSPRQEFRVPCLVQRWARGKSFTGEDMAELLVPGNPLLVERIVRTISTRPSVREAGPGEFSARAYLHGRLSLAQAEAVAGMIAAGSERELQAIGRLMSGELGKELRRYADEVAGMLALVEAGIDFTDQEDVVPIAPEALAARLARLLAELEVLLGSDKARQHVGTAPMVVLAGAPNAGKSTLFNALLGRIRAIASPLAGTTRDALIEPCSLASIVPGTEPVLLVDLPGLDDALARQAVDAEAQAAARATIQQADVVLWCDPTGRFLPSALPVQLAMDQTVIRVRTKADLILADGTSSESSVSVCALDGWQLDALRRALADGAFGTADAAASDRPWLLPRYRRLLTAVRSALQAALAGVPEPTARSLTRPELIAGDLRLALNALGDLAGDISPDDIIGRIFATFCVGK